jgi:glutamine synthetase
MEFLLVSPETLKPVFRNSGEMFSNLTLNKFDPVLLEVASQLEAMGVEVETLQAEYSEGQFELVLKPQIGVKIADNAFLARDCIKEVAKKHGLKAIFMTKMGDMPVCNGMHYNHSLRLTNQDYPDNEFSDVTGTDKISLLCRWWMGGLIRHFRALNAICSPTLNCYRRVNKPWTPIISDWGVNERMSSFRVVNQTPEMTYIESRLPGGSCNPYLTLAATVASGIDGISGQLPCPPPSPTLPKPDDVYKPMRPSKVPVSPTEGLAALREDTYMVDSLGKDFVKWFVLLKEAEMRILEGCDVNKDDPGMYAKERDLYMDLI